MKKALLLILCMALLIGAMAGCKKDENLPAQGENIAATQSGATLNSGTKQYEVSLDERTAEEANQYSMDDLSLVDTISGKRVRVGMTVQEVEEVLGAPMTTDRNTRIYEGLIVLYTEEDQTVASMIVASGLFPNQDQGTRMMSSRGVGLGTSLEDFVKAYGDMYQDRAVETDKDGNIISEALGNATRYFAVEKDKVEYLGTEIDIDTKAQYGENLYMQDFTFDRETNAVSTMRICRVDYLGK